MFRRDILFFEKLITKMTPKISIITVVYNDEKNIRETIESVLIQDYSSIEYIIVDGGSTDATLSIILRYRDRITHIISEKDSGIYDAMNKGASLATGEWIYYLNSGDTLFAVNSISCLFEGKLDTEISILLTDICQYQQIGCGWYRISRPNILTKSPLDDIPACHQAILVRSELQKNYPFDTSFTICADFHFFYRIFTTNPELKWAYRNIPFAVYNMSGVSTRRIVQRMKECHRIAPQVYPVYSIFLKKLGEDFRYAITRLIPNRFIERRRLRLLKKSGWVNSKRSIEL